MKYETTTNAINDGYTSKICVGYCALQNLLQYESPVAYTASREGWAADIYDFGEVAIITGYAPFGNIRPGYELYKKYDTQARKICSDYSLAWDAQKEVIQSLIREFIKEVTAGEAPASATLEKEK